MNSTYLQSGIRNSQIAIKQQKDAKHRMYVLDQWYKTQITYNQDIQASLKVIKPKLISQKIISQPKAQLLFPYFDQMLQISNQMISIISTYKKININDVMIGDKLNKLTSYYKIYLEYFKRKSQIKIIYDDLQKMYPKQLKGIQSDLRTYFQQLYQERAVLKSKLQLQKNDSDKAVFVNPKANITIHDCLQRPLYRLFKYNLLIDNYLKKLSPKHPDYNPLRKTRQLFHQIGQKCNNSFTQQQKQQLKFKLQKLYNASIPNSSQYKTVMSAQNLYFPCNLYIFSNLIIISKTQRMIGFRQQKPYMNLGIDEFSYIQYKKDHKYFKNILLLCGIYQCIHLFLPDKGTRLQIYQLVNKIIKQQKIRSFRSRQHKELYFNNKLEFIVDQQINQTPWLAGINIECIDIDLRQLSMFSNDTAFIIALSIPQYYDDEVTFWKTNSIKQEHILLNESRQHKQINYANYIQKQIQQNRSSLTKQQKILSTKNQPVPFKNFESQSTLIKNRNYTPLNQHIQIHLPVLLQLYKQIKQNNPDVVLPEIDPFSKDFNFYTESKKKTKQFQVRSFLIQQFFNYVFRHPAIMLNPMDIVKKIGIDEQMWEYAKYRSFYIKNFKGDQRLQNNQTKGNLYDHNHCRLCQQSCIESISKFQQIRQRMINYQDRRPQNYCFNSYNLLRNNLLALPTFQFNNLYRMLIYLQYYEGRLDYNFVYKKNLAKVHKSINVYIPKLLPLQERAEDQSIFHTVLQMLIDHKTTVGMIVNAIAKNTQIHNMFDYRLVLTFNESSQRILDQDQNLYNIIEKYGIEAEQCVAQSDKQSVGPRNSYQQKSFVKSTIGVFSFIKNLLPTINKNNSTLYLKKMIYFPMYFEIQAIRINFQRSNIMISQILQKISKTVTSIPFEILGQVCGLYYCILKSKQLIESRASIDPNNAQAHKFCYDMIPTQKMQIIKNKAFINKMMATINERKKLITSINNQTQQLFLQSIYERIIQLGYKQFKINTCTTHADAKRVPYALVTDVTIPLFGNCYIGINHNQIVIRRQKNTLTQAIRIPIQDVQITHSVYSLFLTYKRQDYRENNFISSKQNKIDQFDLRFDSKMLHGFVQLCQKYKLLKNKFGSIMAQYEQLSN